MARCNCKFYANSFFSYGKDQACVCVVGEYTLEDDTHVNSNYPQESKTTFHY